MQKRLQLRVDFLIDINEGAIPANDPQEGYDYMKAQKRLLQVLLSNKQNLRDFLAYRIVGELQAVGFSQWDKLITGKSETSMGDVLSSPIATLSREDQEHFALAAEENYLYEAVEQLDGCFETKLDKAEFVEVEG